jgi:hypothetical protein
MLIGLTSLGGISALNSLNVDIQKKFYLNRDCTFSSWRIGSSMLVFLRIWPMLL